MPSPLDSGWDPLTSLVETEPGIWLMGKGHDQPYAVIRFLEIGGERGYRAVTWARRSEDRKLIGYRKSLRGAARLAHRYQMDLAMRGGYWEGGPKASWDSLAARERDEPPPQLSREG